MRNPPRQSTALPRAAQAGSANPAFASRLPLIDACPGALEQAAAAFDKHGKADALSVSVAGAESRPPVPGPGQMPDGMAVPLHTLPARRGQGNRAAYEMN